MFGKIRYARRMRILWIILLFPFFCSAALELTPDEQAFLKKHPVIRTQCSHGSPAFEQVVDGRPTGYIIEYLRLLSQTAGFAIDFGEGMHAWEETEQKFRDREIDFLTGTVRTDQYDSYALLSEPYLYFQRVYVVRKGARDVHSPDDLIGQTVAAQPELSFVDVWSETYPDINLLMVDNDEEALRAVADGRADATFTLKSTFDYFVARKGFSNLRVGGTEKREEGLENCFRMAVRNDWPELVSIVNKAMNAISQADQKKLWAEWFEPENLVSRVVFTEEEQAYIQNHPVLRYSTLSDAPPLEYCNGRGECIGLTHDYIRRVEEQTGLRLEHVPAQTRTEKFENLQSGRCDFLPTFSPYDVSSDEFWQTDTYLNFPLVVATRMDVPYLNSLKVLAGHRVGLVARIGVLEKYRNDFPGVEFVSCSSVGEGLQQLSQGELFGVIGPQPVVAHQIQELYLGNLKISGMLKESLSLCALVRKEHKPLLGILNKVFRSISPEEKERMLNRWFSIRFEQGFNYDLFWKILAGTGLVQLLILFRYVVVSRYNRKLKTLNRKLEQSLEERDRIMSIISHDLRQPIHGYNQMLALLQSGEINPTNEDGQRILTQSRQRGELAIECMENLLNWLSMRRDVRHPVLLSPRRVVEDCCELLAASLENKQLRLENRVDPALRIHADERRLSAVLRNLINNAIKFSQPGSSIEVEAEQTENGLQLQVRDHGTGMNAETVRKIMGGTAESVRGTEGEKGSGLGLGLCRHFLKEVGSELQVESFPRQGSTFSFILPDQTSRTDC
jgi:polar amino acid transport system substrate-binding protein